MIENKSFMNTKLRQLLSISLAIFSVSAMARENVPNNNISSVTHSRVAAGCAESTSQTDLDVNNVRALILGIRRAKSKFEFSKILRPTKRQINFIIFPARHRQAGKKINI